MQRWAAEAAQNGTFSAVLADEQAASNIGGLPVPALCIGTRHDLLTGAQDLVAYRRIEQRSHMYLIVLQSAAASSFSWNHSKDVLCQPDLSMSVLHSLEPTAIQVMRPRASAEQLAACVFSNAGLPCACVVSISRRPSCMLQQGGKPSQLCSFKRIVVPTPLTSPCGLCEGVSYTSTAVNGPRNDCRWRSKQHREAASAAASFQHPVAAFTNTQATQVCIKLMMQKCYSFNDANCT